MTPMDPIRLQYSTQTAIISLLVRWWTDSQWSHVDAILPDGRLLGARPDYPVEGQTGVQIRAPNYAPFSRRLVVTIATEKAGAFYAALKEEIGKPYAWGKLGAFIVDQDERWHADKAYFCDELLLAAARRSGVFPHALAVPFSRVPIGASLLAFSVLPGFSEETPMNHIAGEGASNDPPRGIAGFLWWTIKRWWSAWKSRAP